jgi:GNAT superfamily N-acetyltransferase
MELTTWHVACCILCIVCPGCGSKELQSWQIVRQGLFALPLRFGVGVTRRLLRADAGEDRQKLDLAPALGAYWYLDYLAVDSALQSRGVGTQALNMCISLAQVLSACHCRHCLSWAVREA